MWIKICGINNLESARQIAALKPNAIGLNFYAPSPRCITPKVAAEIVEALPAQVTPIGLFVNHTAQAVIKICTDLELSTIQLHGDEPPEFLSELLLAVPTLKIIRAWRMGAEGLSSLGTYLERTSQLQIPLFACLIDSRVSGTYGGSGTTVAWDMLNQQYNQEEWPPLILAGGLTPQNVKAAIATIHPFGVDTASGVEASPGVKDISLVQAFIDNAI